MQSLKNVSWVDFKQINVEYFIHPWNGIIIPRMLSSVNLQYITKEWSFQLEKRQVEYFILHVQLFSANSSIRLKIIPEMLLEVSKVVKYNLGQSKKNTDLREILPILS